MRFLLMAIFMAGMVLTGAAFAAETSGPTPVSSSTSGPVVIGWNVVRTQVDAVTVTWTPSATGAYTIDVTVGLSTGRIQTSLIEGAIQRTDLVFLTSPVDVEVVDTVEVVIFQS